MSTDYKFEGWLGKDKSSADGKMTWGEFTPKPFEDNDVDIEIECCGICGSDLHTLRSGWGASNYPVVVGHEVVGKAVKVGKDVKHVKVGDRVGVGAQSRSCLKTDCYECANGYEQQCKKPGRADTYNSKLPDGSSTYGGYAKYTRIQGHWAIPIPKELTSNEAAPALCGGVTVYAPLRNNGCGPGKKVGIVGIGGLGHFGLLFAKALGADEVVAISRGASKKEDALKMGADKFIATDEDEKWAEHNQHSLDLIVSTVSSPKMPLEKYLSLLKFRGVFIQVGAPEDVLPTLTAFQLITNEVKLGGSQTGSVADIKEMLDLIVAKKVKAWVQTRSMKDANKAIVDMDQGHARYRYCLVNEDQGGKL